MFGDEFVLYRTDSTVNNYHYRKQELVVDWILQKWVIRLAQVMLNNCLKRIHLKDSHYSNIGHWEALSLTFWKVTVLRAGCWPYDIRIRETENESKTL